MYIYIFLYYSLTYFRMHAHALRMKKKGVNDQLYPLPTGLPYLINRHLYPPSFKIIWFLQKKPENGWSAQDESSE